MMEISCLARVGIHLFELLPLANVSGVCTTLITAFLVRLQQNITSCIHEPVVKLTHIHVLVSRLKTWDSSQAHSTVADALPTMLRHTLEATILGYASKTIS